MSSDRLDVGDQPGAGNPNSPMQGTRSPNERQEVSQDVDDPPGLTAI